MSAVVWSIGHSTRSQNDFLELLRVHGVRAIADVRRFPASRRHPHFNGEAMATWLEQDGVAYQHFEDLGGRRRPDPESTNTALKHPAFPGYADYMATPAFQRDVERLIDWSREQPTAVMCAEAVWWQATFLTRQMHASTGSTNLHGLKPDRCVIPASCSLAGSSIPPWGTPQEDRISCRISDLREVTEPILPPRCLTG